MNSSLLIQIVTSTANEIFLNFNYINKFHLFLKCNNIIVLHKSRLIISNNLIMVYILLKRPNLIFNWF